MKMKSLLLGLFVAVAFSACSDKAIDGTEGQEASDYTPAYLAISFNTNDTSGNSRSTADDANNNGDQDGNPEESGHINMGTAEERKVNNVLIVAAPVVGNVGYAHVYPMKGETIEGLTPNTNKNEWTTNKLRLGIGEYKILVVVNPSKEILKLMTDISAGDLTDGISTRELYNKIIEGKYQSTDFSTHTKTFWQGSDASNSNIQGFTMANKAEVIRELNAGHTEDSPCTAKVYVERVLSKITFRQKAETATLPQNVYEVEVASSHYKALTESITPAGTSESITVNVAKDAEGNTVYVLYKTDKTIDKVYGLVNNNYVELTAIEKDGTKEEGKNYYIVNNISDSTASLQLQYNEESLGNNNHWYIKLTGYALVNLSKEQFFVRHTVKDNNYGVPFGVLDDNSTYLYTPYWQEKNAVTFTSEGNFATTEPVSTWFYNTLEAVSTDSKTGGKTYFTSLENLNTPYQQDEDKVTGAGNNQHKDENNLDPIGDFLTYCFENSTDVTHQTHGLSTGISFKAEIYKDAKCEQAIDRLYRYENHLFASLQALSDAYYGNIEALKKLAEKGDDAVTREELEAAGVVKYQSNTCYYYTTEIKHFDNGDNLSLGHMEFAIMRNNIYSLAVTSIKNIGDPFVDPTPNIPDEHDNASLEVAVEIIPWIVRYHDIEF